MKEKKKGISDSIIRFSSGSKYSFAFRILAICIFPWLRSHFFFSFFFIFSSPIANCPETQMFRANK